MSGFINNGLNQLTIMTDDDLSNWDTNQAAGQNPESGSLSALRMATWMSFFQNYLDKAPVAGSVFYRKFTISQPITLTGLQYLIGATGGTDLVVGYVFNAAGQAMGNTNLAGATVGTALSWQQLAFVSGSGTTAVPLTLPAGVYYIALQMNGTTARFATYNAPGLTLVTGSTTGAFGTQGTITPATTYTANLGPVLVPYQ